MVSLPRGSLEYDYLVLHHLKSVYIFKTMVEPKKKKKKSLEEKGSLNNFNTMIHKLITYKKSLGEIFSKRGSFTIRNKEIDKMIKI